MKARKALLILAAAATASTLYADKVQLSQAPPLVQQAIRQKAGRHPIEDIDRNVRNGQTVYEASWKGQGGTQQELLVSEAGTILRDIVGASTGLAQQNLTLANKTGVGLTETPQTVQIAIHNQIPNAPIDGIQRGIWNGQNIYEVTYHDNGQLKTYQVTESGQPVVSQTPVAPASWQPRYSNLATQNVPLSAGAKVALISVPVPVQTTITNVAAGAQIEDLERGQWNGRTVYQAAFKRNGQNVELQVLDDGALLNSKPFGAATDPNFAGTPVAKFPGTLGRAANDIRYAGLADGNVQLSGGAKMPFTEAPRAVQTTVNAFANSAPVEDFERGDWNGRTVYEAAFKRNGENIELQVLDDGSILTRQPATAAGAPAAGLSGEGQQ